MFSVFKTDQERERVICKKESESERQKRKKESERLKGRDNLVLIDWFSPDRLLIGHQLMIERRS